MGQMRKATPAAQTILQAWLPFKQAMGVTSVRTKADYTRARATMDTLLNEIGDDEDHPLADVLDFIADKTRRFPLRVEGRRPPAQPRLPADQGL